VVGRRGKAPSVVRKRRLAQAARERGEKPRRGPARGCQEGLAGAERSGVLTDPT